MVASRAKTVAAYLAEQEPDVRRELTRARRLVKGSLPPGYEETMLWGMISYVIPLAKYPDTYNGMPLCIAGLAAQKNHLSLYLLGVYGDPATRKTFEARYKEGGKKLNMGKSCIRFRTVDDLALEAVKGALAAIAPAAYIRRYEAVKNPQDVKRFFARENRRRREGPCLRASRDFRFGSRDCK